MKCRTRLGDVQLSRSLRVKASTVLANLARLGLSYRFSHWISHEMSNLNSGVPAVVFDMNDFNLVWSEFGGLF